MTFDELKTENIQLKAENMLLRQIVEQLTQTVQQLEKTVTELTEKLNKNSRNSSKPPSSDGLNKPNPKSLRGKSGKKVGGQPGHTGVHLSVNCEPDEIKRHLPHQCNGCPCVSYCTENKACVQEKRHIIDMVIEVKVTEHQSVAINCPKLNNQTISGSFPEGINAPVQYGGNLTSLAVALNTVGMVSINRTHEILGGVFNIPISTGAISNMVKRLALSVKDTVTEIRDKITESNITHHDETGTRVDGKTMWVHNSSTPLYTYLSVHPKRGTEGIDDNGVLPKTNGIAVHDCWSPYFTYSVEHSLCCAHLLRELTGVIENHPEQAWAQEMKDLLLEMKKARDKAFEREQPRLSRYFLNKFSRGYDTLVEAGRVQNPIPENRPGKRGRKAKGKVRSLVERLAYHKGEVCLFVHNFNVPFDNNQAERDIRMIKTKTKVSGCFRTKDGADDFAKIMSYIGTAKKLGLNAFHAIKNAVTGSPYLIFQ